MAACDRVYRIIDNIAMIVRYEVDIGPAGSRAMGPG